MISAISLTDLVRVEIEPILMFMVIRYVPFCRMEAKAFSESA